MIQLSQMRKSAIHQLGREYFKFHVILVSYMYWIPILVALGYEFDTYIILFLKIKEITRYFSDALHTSQYLQR